MVTMSEPRMSNEYMSVTTHPLSAGEMFVKLADKVKGITV